MKIEIGEKIKPFSHVPGTRCLVPGSRFVVQAFPALLRIEGYADLPIQVTGPVKEFTVQLDLEKKCVLLWAIAKEGYFKFKLEAIEEGLTLTMDRAPKEGLQIGDKRFVSKEKALIVVGGTYLAVPRTEKLSLGNLKAQEWDLVWRRMELKEIAPALFLLGQMIPTEKDAHGGTETLLKKSLDLFVRTSFSDLLIPRLKDEQHQGIAPVEAGTGDPLALLQKSYREIRSFLIHESNPTLKILPHLPKEWDAGRVEGLHVEGLGEIDLEWSRGQIRRMVLRASRNCQATLLFAKPVDSFRWNGKQKENGESIFFEQSKIYEFDRFQK